MTGPLAFWFDYSCPYAYLASERVEALAGRIARPLALHPMLLGGVFRALGAPTNPMESLRPLKARHNALDMRRWAEHWGLPLRVPEGHPRRTVEALRATLAVGVDPAVVHGFFRAYWVHGQAPSDPATIRQVLAAAGHDPDAALARLEDPALKAELRARTDEAVALGIFGAPSFLLDGELYWGQDRMDLLEAAGRPFAPPAPSTVAAGRTLDLYWDFASPFAYLASTQAEALAARTGVTLRWHPMLLGGVFRAVGQADVPLATWPATRQRYYLQDMHRWAAHWGVPFRFPSRFPTNSLRALRAYLALPEARRGDFRARAFHAYWVDDQDLTDDAVLRALLGPDGDAVLERAGSPEVKQALLDATRRAVDAGVFGAPSWVLDGGEPYWGQDRLGLIEHRLRRGA